MAIYFGTTYDTLENRFRKIKKEAATLKEEVDSGQRGEVKPKPSTPRKPKATPTKEALKGLLLLCNPSFTLMLISMQLSRTGVFRSRLPARRRRASSRRAASLRTMSSTTSSTATTAPSTLLISASTRTVCLLV